MEDEVCSNAPLLEKRGKDEEAVLILVDEAQGQDSDWRTPVCLLGAYCCYELACAGMFTSFVLYLKRVRQEDNASAAATYSAVFGTSSCTSFLAAYLSDGYLGRFWTCVLTLVMFLLGGSFLSTLTQLKVKATAFFTFSIYLTGLGYGWFSPSFLALGGDQFPASQKRSSFYNRVLMFGCFGNLFACTVLVYLENAGYWTLSYWVCTGAAGIGLLFLLGMSKKKRSSNQKKKENPFKRILQVFVASIRKFDLQQPVEPDSMYGSKGSGYSCAKHLRFLDKAAIVTENDLDAQGNNASPWMLCTIKQVEEVRSVLCIVPVWLVILCKVTAITQLVSLFLEQADCMDLMVGGFELAPASMSLVYMFAAIAFTVISDICLRWYSRGIRQQTSSLNIAFTQMGVCFVAATLCIVVAVVVETTRLAAARAGINLSVLWLTPQYALLGVTIVSGTVGEADFFYSAAPPSMRSLTSSIPVINLGLCSYVGGVMIMCVTSFTTAGGKSGWIASDLNEGHLNYFYMLLAGMMIIALVLFLVIALRSSYHTYVDEEDSD